MTSCRILDITPMHCPAGDGQIAPGSFDSLGAVEMANGLSSALGLKLPQTLVFDYPSVKAMTAYVHSLMSPATPSLPVLELSAQQPSVDSLVKVGSIKPHGRKVSFINC